MFMFKTLVCLQDGHWPWHSGWLSQVAPQLEKSGGASITWGGTRAWLPRPPWLVAIWLEVTSPLVTDHQPNPEGRPGRWQLISSRMVGNDQVSV